jgi:hypothetical protein
MCHVQIDAEMVVQIGWAAEFKGVLLPLVSSLLSLAGWSTARLPLSLAWTKAGDQALLVSGVCGPHIGNSNGLLDVANLQAVMVSAKKELEVASAYETTCYAGDPGKRVETYGGLRPARQCRATILTASTRGPLMTPFGSTTDLSSP